MSPKRPTKPLGNYHQHPVRTKPLTYDMKRAQYQYCADHELVMLIPAKCASTSVRGAFKVKGCVLSRPEVISSGLPVYMMLRHPVARFYSAWSDKFSTFFPFEEVLSAVEKTPDNMLDVHLEPYTCLTKDIHITKYLTVDTWSRHQELPPLPHKNATHRGKDWRQDLDPTQVARIMARYSEDDKLYTTHCPA